MIFRNFAFIALVVASSTLNSAHADRTKLRGRWQVGDAKDVPVDDAAVDIAGTSTDAGLRRRRELKKNDDKKDESKKDSKKDDKKGGNNNGNADSTDVGAGNHAAKQKKKNNDEKETAVISNMAGTGNMSPVITSVKPPKDEKDAKKNDKKGGGGDKVKNDAKKKNDKNMETGMYAGTFNYAAVRPQAWNPSAVTLGSAQTSNTNYASPGAATGNMVAGNSVSSAGVYRVSQNCCCCVVVSLYTSCLILETRYIYIYIYICSRSPYLFSLSSQTFPNAATAATAAASARYQQ